MNRFHDTETDQLKGTTCCSFLPVSAVYRQYLDITHIAFSLLPEGGLFSSSGQGDPTVNPKGDQS